MSVSSALPRPPKTPGRSLNQTSMEVSTTYTLDAFGLGEHPRYGDPRDMFEPSCIEITVYERKNASGQNRGQRIEQIRAIDVSRDTVELHTNAAMLPEYLQWALRACGFEDLIGS